MQEADRFKEIFKKYKICKDYNEFKNFAEVVDVDRAQEFIDRNLVVKKSITELRKQYNNSCTNSVDAEEQNHNCQPLFGLTHPSSWDVYEFNFPKGLIFIRNPFTTEGQRYWISKCVSDYPQKPHITNMDNLKRLRQNVDIENTTGEEKNEQFYKDLRWITFGYHHCWDTKIYSEDHRCLFPNDLSCLTKYMAIVLGYHFEAEAAIVNYYHLDSTLSGHVDRSEKNQYAPLFSLSFGQTCLFLIGAETKDKTPLAVYLKSGDVVVMTGPSRLSYHGVPKILPALDFPWNHSDLEKLDEQPNDSSDDTISSPSKKIKLDQDSKDKECIPCPLCDLVHMSKFNESDSDVKRVVNQWSDFHKLYISKSRINLNVRQVLFPGQKSLDDENYVATVS